MSVGVKGYHVCPECKRRKQLDARGRFRIHNASYTGSAWGAPICKGSGEVPK